MNTPRTITSEEIDKFLTHVLDLKQSGIRWTKSVRNYLLIVLMLDAGLRVGEVVKLSLLDVWLNSEPVSSLLVRCTIAKRKKERLIPLSIRARDAIQLYMKEVYHEHDPDYHPFLFPAYNTLNHISTRQVERMVDIYSYRSLGRSITPHVLRHTFASRLMRVTNIRVVQELLGHSNISSTQIYTHPNGDDLKNAIDNVESDLQVQASNPDVLS